MNLHFIVFLLAAINLIGCISNSTRNPLTLEIITNRFEVPRTTGGFLKGKIGINENTTENITVVEDMTTKPPTSSGSSFNSQNRGFGRIFFPPVKQDYFLNLGILESLDIVFNRNYNNVGIKYGPLKNNEQGLLSSITIKTGSSKNLVSDSRNTSSMVEIGASKLTTQSGSTEVKSLESTFSIGKNIYLYGDKLQPLILYFSFTQADLKARSQLAQDVTNVSSSNVKTTTSEQYSFDDNGTQTILASGLNYHSEKFEFTGELGASRLTWPRAKSGIFGIAGFQVSIFW